MNDFKYIWGNCGTTAGNHTARTYTTSPIANAKIKIKTSTDIMLAISEAISDKKEVHIVIVDNTTSLSIDGEKIKISEISSDGVVIFYLYLMILMSSKSLIKVSDADRLKVLDYASNQVSNTIEGIRHSNTIQWKGIDNNSIVVGHHNPF